VSREKEPLDTAPNCDVVGAPCRLAELGVRGVSEMNTQQMDTLLETLAKLVEATKADTEQAAKIIRDAKSK